MRQPPIGNSIIIIAVANGAADHQQQHLRQGMGHPPRLARVFNGRKMIEKRFEARLLETYQASNRHGRCSESVVPHGISHPARVKAH